MSYSIDIDPAAQDAIAALPMDALLALAEVFAALEVAPWNVGRSVNPERNPDSGVRNFPSGPRAWSLIWWWSISSELTSCSSLGPGCHKHAATRTTALMQLAVVGGCLLASAQVCIQEAADLHVQGFRLPEEVSLPGMVRMAVRFAAAALSLSPVLQSRSFGWLLVGVQSEEQNPSSAAWRASRPRSTYEKRAIFILRQVSLPRAGLPACSLRG